MLSDFLHYNDFVEKLFSNIVGTPVYLEDGKHPIAMVRNVVMDTEKGKLLGFVIDIGRDLIIVDRDVLEFGDVLHIHDENDIIEGCEVVKVDVVNKKGIKLLANNVETREGKVLGKVVDFSVDSNTLDLKKIFVAKTVLGLLQYDQRIFPATKIVEILKDKVVVENDLEDVKEGAIDREAAAA